VKSYNSSIKKNPKVDLVLVSLDRDAGTAKKWAKKEKFPWPTVLQKDYRASGLNKYAGRGVPHYVMINRKGKVICTGKHQCFAKLKSLK